MLNPAAVSDALANTACRLYGLDDVGNDAHRRVVATLAAGFDSPETTVLVEPTFARGREKRTPDVVVIDPVAGVHVVEVKGHDLSAVTELRTGGKMWLDHGGRPKEADPVAQARRAMFAVQNGMGEFSAAKPTLAFEAWAVFPNISRGDWAEKWGAGTYEPEYLLFAEDLEPGALADRMRAVGEARLPAGRERHDPEELARVHRVFGDHSVLSPTVPRPGRDVGDAELLGARIDREAARYRELSEEQRRLSEADFSTGPRLIRGVAGSGKTVVLANNLARRLVKAEAATGALFVEDAAPPPRFLAVCFNQTLAPFLRSRIQIAYQQRAGQMMPPGAVTVRNFNSLMFDLSQAGLAAYRRIKEHPDGPARARAYLAEVEQVAEREPDRLARFAFDAIYVDEAQDLEEDELRLLIRLAKQNDAGEPGLAIFYDDAQNLYGRARPRWSDLGLAMSGRSHIMTTCYRNPREVVEPAFNVLNGAFAPRARDGVTAAFADLGTLRQKEAIVQREGQRRIEVKFAPRRGTPISIRRFDSAAQEADHVARRVERMVRDEKVRPHDILVLTHRRERVYALAERLNRLSLEGFRGCRVAIDEKDKLVAVDGYFSLCTVHSAKGYDANVVLLASAQDFKPDAQGRAAFYVGCTRAQQCLEVTGFGSAPLVDELELASGELIAESVAE